MTGFRHAGFTLIELLVVLVIIGIALGTVAVRLMPDDSSRLRDEAEQLALLLENAGLEARSSGTPMAWLPEEKGYQFWLRNEQGNWKPVEEGPYRFRTWQEHTHIGPILVDKQPLKFGERMLLSASALPTPFTIHLELGDARADINNDGSSDVTVHMGGDAVAATAQ